MGQGAQPLGGKPGACVLEALEGGGVAGVTRCGRGQMTGRTAGSSLEEAMLTFPRAASARTAGDQDATQGGGKNGRYGGVVPGQRQTERPVSRMGIQKQACYVWTDPHA